MYKRKKKSFYHWFMPTKSHIYSLYECSFLLSYVSIGKLEQLEALHANSICLNL